MKKIWDKKSMLNFSRQAYNEKVTDCHALFRILRFFEIIYIMLLSDLEKLLSVWENVLSIANVT